MLSEAWGRIFSSAGLFTNPTIYVITNKEQSILTVSIEKTDLFENASQAFLLYH